MGADHEKDKYDCAFYRSDKRYGCIALSERRCGNCNFFQTDAEYVRGRAESWEKFKKSKKFEKLKQKYYK